MKRIVYIFCIALLGVACSKEDVNKIEIVKTIDVPDNMVKLSITVPRKPETKAEITGKQLSFAPEDEIAVIGTLNAETSVVTLEVETISASEITFSAVIDEDMEIGDYAYFPTSIVNKDNPTQINWPSSFDGTKVQMPMMAKIDVTGPSAVFHYLGAMLKVNLDGAPSGVNALEFKTTNNFVGSYNVTFDGNNISSMVANSLSGNTETLSVASSGTYYVPIPAGTYSEFQLAMKQGAYYHKQRTSDLDAAINPLRGNIVNLGNFTYDVDQIEEWWLQSDVNGWNNGYNRFIKTGTNTYQLTTYNRKDNPYWKLLNGTNATSWNVTDNAQAWSGTLSNQGWTFYRTGADDKTFWITLSDGGATWTYNSGNWDTNSPRNYPVSSVSVKLLTTLDLDSDGNTDWDDEILLTKYDFNENYCYHYNGLVIPDNREYKIKFKAIGPDWNWVFGGTGINIKDSTPYATCVSEISDEMSLSLTPGRYDIYLDIAILNFMFVKQPYSD